MSLIRLLFLALIGWLVWSMIARALRASAAPPRSPKADPEYIPLTKCSVCGTNFPQPRAGVAPICERCRSG